MNFQHGPLFSGEGAALLPSCIDPEDNAGMNELVRVAVEAARRGGKQLMKWRGRITAREKGPRDLVTEADLVSQEAIASFLGKEFPQHAFLGEEEPDLHLLEDAETIWVVDPLDGTTNYVHGMNAFAVSIALIDRGQIVAGVVLDPVSNECFSAARKEGAWLNEKPIRVSSCDDINQALIAASFPTQVAPDSLEERQFLGVLRRSQAVRRIGSAALNLAFVAAGRLDGYWASSVKAWDIAAGILLVQEAGGIATHTSGSEISLIDPRFAAAATETLHATLLQILDQHTDDTEG